MRAELTGELRKPITGRLATGSGTSAWTKLGFYQCTCWRSHAATWVSLMTPSAHGRRGIAPGNIATFNTHTEALEPMGGAV